MSAAPKPGAIGRQPDDARLLLQVWATVRANIGLLLFIDLALSAASLPVVATVAVGGYVIAPIIAAVCVGPFWMGAIATAAELHRDAAASPRRYLRLVRRNAVQSVGISLVPGGVAAILLGTLALFSTHTDKTWLAIPLLADCSVTVLGVIACFSAYSYGLAGLRGRLLWIASLIHAARRPAETAGLFALLVLIALATVRLTPMAALLASPLAVLLAALTAQRLESNVG